MNGSSRSPQFRVLANLLLAIAMLGAGLRFSTRFLPEEQPNRLAQESSPYLSRSAREKVDWHPVSETPFLIAQSSKRLILVEIGTVFSRAANTHRLRFYSDEEFVRLLNSHFVCIRADLNELPGLGPAIDLNTMGIAASGGMIVLVLTSDGHIAGVSPYRRLRSDQEPVGMYEWLSEFARRHSADTEALKLEAESLHAERKKEIEAQLTPGILSVAMPRAFADSVVGAFDRETGRIDAVVATVAPPLFSLLRTTSSQHAGELLKALRESAAYDSVEGGFFECFGERTWTNPEYGKRTGRSALLAAEFARMSKENPEFAVVARQSLDWIMSLRDDTNGFFVAGRGTDEEVLGGSEYYDFSLEEAAAAGYRVANPGAPSLPIAARNATPSSLLALRGQRTQPDLDSGVYADVNGMAFAGIYASALLLDDEVMSSRADAIFDRLVAAFVLPLGDVRHAQVGRANSTGYAGDYVWIARAAIERYRATSNPDALALAERVMSRCSELFEMRSGALMTNLESQFAFARFVLPIAETSDTPDESICALAARNYLDLALMSGKPDYRRTAERILSASAGSIAKHGIGALGMTAAIAQFFQPSILVSAESPRGFVSALSRDYPHLSVAPTARLSQRGYYWVVGNSVEGPLTLAELSARAQAFAR